MLAPFIPGNLKLAEFLASATLPMLCYRFFAISDNLYTRHARQHREGAQPHAATSSIAYETAKEGMIGLASSSQLNLAFFVFSALTPVNPLALHLFCTAMVCTGFIIRDITKDLSKSGKIDYCKLTKNTLLRAGAHGLKYGMRIYGGALIPASLLYTTCISSVAGAICHGLVYGAGYLMGLEGDSFDKRKIVSEAILGAWNYGSYEILDSFKIPDSQMRTYFAGGSVIEGIEEAVRASLEETLYTTLVDKFDGVKSGTVF